MFYINMEDALIFLLKGSASYLLADLFFSTILSPKIKSVEVPVKFIQMPVPTQIQEPSPSNQSLREKPSKKHEKFTLTDPIPDTKVLLPLKRFSTHSIDNFKYTHSKVLPIESTIEIKKKILCIEKNQNKPKLPLYGLTSPVPYPSRHSIPSQKF